MSDPIDDSSNSQAMKRILVTGATGNIGMEVIHFLSGSNDGAQIIAAVRNVDKAKTKFRAYHALDVRVFDFEDPKTYSAAFNQIDILFLLRPPHISEVEKVFKPLLLSAKEKGIQKLVFLSVQGAEKSKVIPHNKIEGLIQSLGFDCIFVRPSYFMQNLTTTLIGEIKSNRSITLPAGKAKFNWIDVKNIGEVTAKLILEFDQYRNKPFVITGQENMSFGNVAKLISESIGEEIHYKSINPISFYFKKKKEGMQSGFAIVMTILHFLPRLQQEPEITSTFEDITGKKPTELKAFILREQHNFSN